MASEAFDSIAQEDEMYSLIYEIHDRRVYSDLSVIAKVQVYIPEGGWFTSARGRNYCSVSELSSMVQSIATRGGPFHMRLFEL